MIYWYSQWTWLSYRRCLGCLSKDFPCIVRLWLFSRLLCNMTNNIMRIHWYFRISPLKLQKKLRKQVSRCGNEPPKAAMVQVWRYIHTRCELKGIDMSVYLFSKHALREEVKYYFADFVCKGGTPHPLCGHFSRIFAQKCPRIVFFAQKYLFFGQKSIKCIFYFGFNSVFAVTNACAPWISSFCTMSPFIVFSKLPQIQKTSLVLTPIYYKIIKDYISMYKFRIIEWSGNQCPISNRP